MSRKKKTDRSRKRFILTALTHFLALGVALCLFALLHHVIPAERESLGVTSSRDAMPVSEPIQTTPEPTPMPEEEPATEIAAPEETEAPEATAEPDRTGYFGKKFADKFIEGEPQITENSYVSQNVNVTVETYTQTGLQFYVADIYVRDISNLTRQFAKDRYGKAITEDICKLAKRVESVVTLNGDYYGTRDDGVVMVNGELFNNDKVYRDIGVLYWDGTFKCFRDKRFDCMAEVENGAYQIWNFGPAFLNADSGPVSDFDSVYDGVEKAQPRSAFGYYEPGHYCFINVEGRLDRSRGLSFKEMGKLAQKLGLTQLYGMDGGKTAELAFGNKMVNKAPAGGRPCSDYICIIDKAV